MQNVAFSGKVKKGGNLKWILLCVFLAVAIAGAVIVVVLASTGKTFPEIPQTEEEKAPVFTLGDTTATYDLYRFYFLGHKHLLSGGNDAYFDEMDTDSVFAEIDADVREDIAYLYAMFAFAAQLGVTEKEIDELYEELLRMTKSGGEFAGTPYLGYKSEEEYRKSLAANHMNDAVYRLTLRAYAAEYKATERFAATASQYISSKDEDMYAFYMGEDAVHVAYAYIDKSTFLGTNEAYELAVTAEAQLRAVSDDLASFIRTAIQYSSPSVSTSSLESGMYLTRYHASNLAQEELTEVAFSLAAGEMSGIVETDDGYFILRRMSTSEDELKQADRELLYESYFSNHFYKRLHEVAASLREQMTEAEYYGTLTFETFNTTGN